MERLSHPLEHKLGRSLTPSEKFDLSRAMALLVISLDHKVDLHYCPSEVSAEDLQCYFEVIEPIRRVYGSDRWIPVAVNYLSSLLARVARRESIFDPGHQLWGSSVDLASPEGRPEIYWHYLLAILYDLAGADLLAQLRAEFNTFRVLFTKEQLHKQFHFGTHFGAAFILKFMELYPLFARLPGRHNFELLYKTFDIAHDLNPIQWSMFSPGYGPAELHNPANRILLNRYPWRRDQQFLQHILDVARSIDEYGGHNRSILEPILLDLLFRAQEWRQQVRKNFGQRIREYLYAPGMPGTARMKSHWEQSQGSVCPQCQAHSITTFRQLSRKLMNRLTKAELAEILQRYGQAHGIMLPPTPSKV